MRDSFVIFCGSESWSVTRSHAGTCSIVSTEPSPSAVAAELKKLGYQDQGVLLALPSRMCLCASVDSSGLRSRNRQAGLLFRLEEQLPIALEEIVADFISVGTKSLGIVVPIESVQPMIETLENQGIQIDNICPSALLIADQVWQTSPLQDKPDFILCALDGGIDLVEIREGRITNWTLLPVQINAIELHLRRAAANRAGPIRVDTIGILPEVPHQLAEFPTIQMMSGPGQESLDLLGRATERIFSTVSPPPVELRRHRLALQDPLRQARTPLRAAIAAAIVLAVSLAISMFWRAHQYNGMADSSYTRQLQSFKDALPEQTPPFGIMSRMVSETRRLQGLSGTGSAMLPSMSILPLLRNTLAALPKDSRFRLLELRFEPERLYLEGQTLDHSDADQIAAALRQGTTLQVDPPHTEQPAGEDVTFTISGAALTLSSDAIPAADKGGAP